MNQPQAINANGQNPDAVLAIWGGNVLYDSGPTVQDPMTIADSPLLVDVSMFDITLGTAVATVPDATMTFFEDQNHWAIDLDTGTGTTIRQALAGKDGHKMVANISDGDSQNMRSFVLEEFVIDDGGFENVLMKLPFDITNVSGTLHMVWYDAPGGTPLYKAPVFQGGAGFSTPATDASNVTHRGAIVDY